MQLCNVSYLFLFLLSLVTTAEKPQCDYAAEKSQQPKKRHRTKKDAVKQVKPALNGGILLTIFVIISYKKKKKK